MRITQIVAAALIGLTAITVGRSANAQIITNGSFEMASPGHSVPTAGSSGESLPNGSTAILGWTVFGGVSYDGLAWLPNGAYGLSTPYGNDFLDLTGYDDVAPYFGVEQTIATTPGQSYTLTFSLGVDQNGGPYRGPIGVTATAGSTSNLFNNVDPVGTGLIWTGESLSFTATGATTLIKIQGAQGDQYIGLDNVAVNVSAVPEVDALWLTLLGAGFVALVVRKKGAQSLLHATP